MESTLETSMGNLSGVVIPMKDFVGVIRVTSTDATKNPITKTIPTFFKSHAI
ncbi:MAG: hypothetical protein ACTSUE_12120 [Promethearchaeota archaeon]